MNQQNTDRHKRTSVTFINYHFVWCPKRRKKVLTGNIAQRLEGLLYEKASELDCQIIALEIMPDHVHLFISTPPSLAPRKNHDKTGQTSTNRPSIFTH